MPTQKDYRDAIAAVEELEDALVDLGDCILPAARTNEVRRVVSMDLSRDGTVRCVIEASDQSGPESHPFSFPWSVVRHTLAKRRAE